MQTERVAPSGCLLCRVLRESHNLLLNNSDDGEYPKIQPAPLTGIGRPEDIHVKWPRKTLTRLEVATGSRTSDTFRVPTFY